jgi:hypothetical protein
MVPQSIEVGRVMKPPTSTLSCVISLWYGLSYMNPASSKGLCGSLVAILLIFRSMGGTATTEPMRAIKKI